MWYKFIRIIKRKIGKEKRSTFTKLFSLSIGLVSLFYISIYLNHEQGYDNFHTNGPQIFKINTTIQSQSGDLALGLTAVPVAAYAKSVAPEVQDFVRINKAYGSHAIKHKDKLFSESENIYYADASFFNFFDFKLLAGNKAAALEGPNKIIITENTALKYFGSIDVLGEVLLYDDAPMTVSGIIQNLPSNTHLEFDFLVSMATFMQSRPDADENWSWFPMNTYVLLNNSENSANLFDKLKAIPHYLPENSTQDKYSLSLEPFEGLHFSSVKLGEIGPKGKRSNMYLLFAIGIMIMLLAISNFINLTTSQLSVRGKEVSIKKTIGASKGEIIRHFFTESLLLTALATIVSAVLIALSFTYFESFMKKEFPNPLAANPMLLIALPLIPLALSVLGGIYPAIKFSKISSVPTASNVVVKPEKTWNTRTGLLVFQFCITSALIICSLLIYNQLSFLNKKDTGMDTHQKVVVEYGPNAEIGNSFESLKQALGNVPGVESVSFSSHVPGQIPNGAYTEIVGLNGISNGGEINLNLVDYDFIDNYGLNIIAGRDFRQGPADRTSALILNESAVKAFGFESPEAILGASFTQWGGDGKVIGVVSDFNYMSLHDDIGLLSLKIWPDQYMKATLTISDKDIQGTLKNLEDKWTGMYPAIPFLHYFVDDNFRAQYDKDQQFATIINLFAIIAICIGILGLIAYASFWCERRRKEMSIRKVLGAESLGLIWNLYKGFSLPVLIGFFVAIPISYYFGSRWLQQFAYHFELKWYFFALPLLILLGLVWVAVGAQAIQVVRANPANNLKEG